jgi:hypothetical protein
MSNSLRLAIDDSVTTLVLENSNSFPVRGFVQIDSELISYDYSSDLELLQCVRGVGGTVAAPHLINAVVTYVAALPSLAIGLDLDGQTLDEEIRLSNGVKITVSGDDIIFTSADDSKSYTISLV